jgi:pimeloyl-ACP methyl ester carboxylesterase
MARHLRLLPQSLEVDTAMIVGHSMGAMAAARFATPYLDSMISDWEHVQAPTLLFGGTEDSLPGSAAVFQQRMQIVAERIPNG